jgi:trehalose/maltose hydrolase-like predicted phosphorylase
MDRNWTIVYDGYQAEQEGLREALCTLGNGYFATRAAAPEHHDETHHYPGTYLAGGYNRLPSEISGKVIENEDLVNWPNWLPLSFKAEDGEWLSLDNMKLKGYQQRLDLKSGILRRAFTVEDAKGRQTQVNTQRLVHMQHPHIAALQWKVTPLNWSGKMEVRSALDGSVTNNGVPRYRALNSQHLEVLDKGIFKENGLFLKCQTTQSEVVMAQAAVTNVFFERSPAPLERRNIDEAPSIAAQVLSFEVEPQREVEIIKIVAVYTSRDVALSDPVQEAQKAVLRAADFNQLCEEQQRAWARMWKRADTQINGDHEEAQLVLRLHAFHLLQTVSLNSLNLDISVPARGWHGEAYRGHIFWDELFILPLVTRSLPELARSLLMYRYRRLPEARRNAVEEGYTGAMFPWQSGSNGREESQKIHLNPKSGNWMPDNSRLQMHVNASITFNVWRYFQATEDWEFLYFYGAEMMLDIHKFWASKVSWNEQRQRYEIRGVVGPDEYHTAYPDSDSPGLNNNAYTNLMVVWGFKHSLEMLEMLSRDRRSELLAQLHISEEDLHRWEHISRQMYVPFIGESSQIISQYEGFGELEELDWAYYHEEYGEHLRLDRIMEKEGKDVNRYKATKQADVLMLFFLFSASELGELLQRCGYDFKSAYIPENIKYYEGRTAHGSTLSQLVYSWVLARSNRAKSWTIFNKALMSDFKDVQGGTTPEGIHLGAMAGTVDLIQRCYTGLEVRSGKLWFDPQLPEELGTIAFRVRYRGVSVEVELKGDQLRVQRREIWNDRPITVVVKGQSFELAKGEGCRFRYSRQAVEAVETL